VVKTLKEEDVVYSVLLFLLVTLWQNIWWWWWWWWRCCNRNYMSSVAFGPGLFASDRQKIAVLQMRETQTTLARW